MARVGGENGVRVWSGAGSCQALPGLLPAYLASDFRGMRKVLEAC